MPKRSCKSLAKFISDSTKWKPRGTVSSMWKLGQGSTHGSHNVFDGDSFLAIPTEMESPTGYITPGPVVALRLTEERWSGLRGFLFLPRHRYWRRPTIAHLNNPRKSATRRPSVDLFDCGRFDVRCPLSLAVMKSLLNTYSNI
jgi:hypothetical protein